MSEPQQRKFGYPWLMLAGFFIAAGLAVGIAFYFHSRRAYGPFMYEALSQLVLCLGSLGAYAGHGFGGVWNKEGWRHSFGAESMSWQAKFLGAVIVLVGTILVTMSVMGIMTLVYGTPPPHHK